MKYRLALATFLSILAAPAGCLALVNYEKGQEFILGVQLLQDTADANAYYYVPQFPRLSSRPDGTFEIVCTKFVGADGAASGGLFHALIEFTLPADVLADLTKELNKKLPQARIVGPVPLLPAVDKGEEGLGSFQVISSVLSNKQGERAFTRTLVTSGSAPLSPGSKAAVAAVLSPEGATLLWDSLKGATSDVSIGIRAYYEAQVEAYNAKVTANIEAIYDHYSNVANRANGFTRRDIRTITDELKTQQLLKVEVFDRTVGLNVKDEFMPAILQQVTDKLTELMFDSKNGWAVDPPRETAIEAGQIQGRQERGWLSRIFGGAEDTKYFTDNQYTLKKIEDIRRRSFELVLSKKTTIRVPVDTAGNLGGLYKAFGDDERYFKIESLDDPAYESRTIHFQLDGTYADSFQDQINFVSVTMRKIYAGQPASTPPPVVIQRDDIKNGQAVKDLTFKRLGMVGTDWLDYEYQVRWGVRDQQQPISVPAGADNWIRSRDPAVTLVPPFAKRVLELDIDSTAFKDSRVTAASVTFHSTLGGQKIKRSRTLRPATAATTPVAVYHDREDGDVVVQIFWHFADGTTEEQRIPLPADADNYLYLAPPHHVPVPPFEPGGDL
jgi:hypothetical protein